MKLFEYVTATPFEQLCIGAREHAFLATEAHDAVKTCLNRDRWTCHICRIKLQHFMEIDHIVSHDDRHEDRLRAICPFCHNLKHPVWAALRGRFRVIWAPSLKQETINRMAWVALLSERYRKIIPELADSAEELLWSVQHRETLIADLLGAAHAEALLESLFTIRPHLDEDAFSKRVSSLDSIVRFWPVAADRIISPVVRSSSGLSKWHKNQFVDVSIDLIDQSWNEKQELEWLREALEANSFD